MIHAKCMGRTICFQCFRFIDLVFHLLSLLMWKCFCIPISMIYRITTQNTGMMVNIIDIYKNLFLPLLFCLTCILISDKRKWAVHILNVQQSVQWCTYALLSIFVEEMLYARGLHGGAPEQVLHFSWSLCQYLEWLCGCTWPFWTVMSQRHWWAKLSLSLPSLEFTPFSALKTTTTTNSTQVKCLCHIKH